MSRQSLVVRPPTQITSCSVCSTALSQMRMRRILWEAPPVTGWSTLITYQLKPRPRRSVRVRVGWRPDLLSLANSTPLWPGASAASVPKPVSGWLASTAKQRPLVRTHGCRFSRQRPARRGEAVVAENSGVYSGSTRASRVLAASSRSEPIPLLGQLISTALSARDLATTCAARSPFPDHLFAADAWRYNFLLQRSSYIVVCNRPARTSDPFAPGLAPWCAMDHPVTHAVGRVAQIFVPNILLTLHLGPDADDRESVVTTGPESSLPTYVPYHQAHRKSYGRDPPAISSPWDPCGCIGLLADTSPANFACS